MTDNGERGEDGLYCYAYYLDDTQVRLSVLERDGVFVTEMIPTKEGTVLLGVKFPLDRQLQTENARLRAFVERVATSEPGHDYGCVVAYLEFRNDARELLKQKEPPRPS